MSPHTPCIVFFLLCSHLLCPFISQPVLLLFATNVALFPSPGYCRLSNFCERGRCAVLVEKSENRIMLRLPSRLPPTVTGPLHPSPSLPLSLWQPEAASANLNVSGSGYRGTARPLFKCVPSVWNWSSHVARNGGRVRCGRV
eukprot:1062754-Rhodomonas_salina.1